MANTCVRVSVVVPTLNEEKLLGAMLGQFPAETRARYGVEVIVSDGGSTDATLSIAKKQADIVVENLDGTRQTIALGRNLGGAKAKGGILVFLNADTRLNGVDDFFQTIDREFSRDGTVALTCTVDVFPEEKRCSDRIFHGFFNWLFYMMNQVGLSMGRGECHVVRAETFRAIGGYASGIAAGEDYDLFRRLAAHGRIEFLKTLVVYESPRRFREMGYGRVMASWFVNWLFVHVLRRSVSDEWRAVR